MSTALAQAEDALRRYQLALSADSEQDVRAAASKSTRIVQPQGVHGTAFGPSETMNMLGDPTHTSIVDFYEVTKDVSPEVDDAQRLFVQAYWQAWSQRERSFTETINEVTGGELSAFAYPMIRMTSPATSSKSFPDKSDFVISRDLQYDALRFVSWLDGWDGENGERIHCDVAFRALEIVSRLRPEFDEPSMAPAPNGAILLQWNCSDETTVDLYVEHSDSFPECAVLTRDESVDDVELSNLSDLRTLLRDLESASASH